MVAMTFEQYDCLERLIPKLMHERLEREACLMMNLALAWRFAKPVEPVLPSNVVAFPEQHSRRVGA